jgi:hypothetical protein
LRFRHYPAIPAPRSCPLLAGIPPFTVGYVFESVGLRVLPSQVDEIGEVTVTNDGATILKELEVEHPAARTLVELAERQDREVGDGTTSVVILAAELLKVR